MMKRFRSKTAALRFAAGRKIKAGKATKLKDGTKARWYSITKKTKAKRK